MTSAAAHVLYRLIFLFVWARRLFGWVASAWARAKFLSVTDNRSRWRRRSRSRSSSSSWKCVHENVLISCKLYGILCSVWVWGCFPGVWGVRMTWVVIVVVVVVIYGAVLSRYARSLLSRCVACVEINTQCARYGVGVYSIGERGRKKHVSHINETVGSGKHKFIFWAAKFLSLERARELCAERASCFSVCVRICVQCG